MRRTMASLLSWSMNVLVFAIVIAIICRHQNEKTTLKYGVVAQEQMFINANGGQHLNQPFIARFLQDRQDRGEFFNVDKRILPTTFRTNIVIDDDDNAEHICHDKNCDHHHHHSHHPPPANNNNNKSQGKSYKLKSSCICGKCQFDFNIDPNTKMNYCHCKGCRRYTVGPFASSVAVSTDDIDKIVQKFTTNSDGTTSMPISKTQCSPCEITSSPTVVAATSTTKERFHCSECYTPLAYVETNNDNGSIVSCSIPAGSIDDNSIDIDLALWWQTDEGQTHVSKRAFWPLAKPTIDNKQQIPNDPIIITGGCGCGKVQYRAATLTIDMQHCYCRLCRQACGTAYQTWVPLHYFEFTKAETLDLIRTTPQGQRHVCTDCGGYLTILYDSQPDVIWAAAGSFDDESLPSSLSSLEERILMVMHICCEWMQPWYRLPDDGLMRKGYPG